MKEKAIEIGKKHEEEAANYLKSLNYKILELNFKLLPIGEIDIIAKDKDTFVFVEVKYRKNNNYGTPAEFVTKTKQSKVIKTALCYLKKNRIKADFRFDVVSICGNEIDHIPNAFVANRYYI